MGPRPVNVFPKNRSPGEEGRGRGERWVSSLRQRTHTTFSFSCTCTFSFSCVFLYIFEHLRARVRVRVRVQSHSHSLFFSIYIFYYHFHFHDHFSFTFSFPFTFTLTSSEFVAPAAVVECVAPALLYLLCHQPLWHWFLGSSKVEGRLRGSATIY